MSFSADFAGFSFGRGLTSALFNRGGRKPCRSEALYMSLMTGASSGGNSFRTTFGSPSGPGAFLILIPRKAFCASQGVVSNSGGIDFTAMPATSSGVKLGDKLQGEVNEKVVYPVAQGSNRIDNISVN